MGRLISRFYMKGIIIKDGKILLELPKTKTSSTFEIPTVVQKKFLNKEELIQAFMERTGAKCEIKEMLGSVVNSVNSSINFYLLDFKKMYNVILPLDVDCATWVDLNEVNKPGVLNDGIVKVLLNEYMRTKTFEKTQEKIDEIVNNEIKEKKIDEQKTADSYESMGLVY